MSNLEFWKRCSDAGCVVIPLTEYSQYDEQGDLGEEYFVGLRFVAVPFYGEIAGREYFFLIDECLSGNYKRFNTPQEALSSFIEKHP